MKFNYSALAAALLLAVGATAANALEAGDIPPNPQPGECYARVYIPPTSETTYDTVVTREASKKIHVIPAVYGKESQRILVKEASTKLMVKPATYKTVTEEITVKPATTRLVVVPATYKNVTETVVVKEATTQWKRGKAWLGKAIDTKTYAASSGRVDDDVMCLVEIPAVTKTITRRVEATPATTREVTIPAVTKVVTKRVVDTPASTYEVEVPAVYKTVSVTTVVKPAEEKVTEIPAAYGKVAKTRQVTEGSHEWRSILCETNATPVTIRALQSALKSKGYHPGPIDGIIKTQTMSAVNAYQRANSLPVDPYINMETVKSLGVSI